MFDDVAAERLERLERGIRRRKWDSAVMAAQKGRWDEDGSVADPSRPVLETPLTDLLAERIERLEGRYRSFEWQLRRLERRSGWLVRAILVQLAVVTLASALFAVRLALAPLPATGPAVVRELP